ncbi:hypothetical protein DEO72_LG5g1988 [Vigna unguiculata]|uniref:Uncharacterized protein n=1 Tax=Vigna unguiculata TaxID=3917 RepID=A0A4D6M001_VIGUN|nr:hypothetical protein DEO72_LG5g1988 [Vigna unguiculata]
MVEGFDPIVLDEIPGLGFDSWIRYVLLDSFQAFFFDFLHILPLSAFHLKACWAVLGFSEKVRGSDTVLLQRFHS